MKNNILYRIIIVILLIILLANWNNSAEASTEIQSPLTEDTHLTKENSPYIVGGSSGLYVAPDVNLVIDPGVSLFLNSGWLYIDKAHLQVGATSSQEKVFFDKADDAKDWAGIYVNDSDAVIKSFEIRNARSPIISENSTTTIDDAYIDAQFQKNASIGIYARNGILHVSSSTVSHFLINSGIQAHDTDGYVNNSVITGNRTGIFFGDDKVKDFSGEGNRFDGNTVYNIFNNNEATTIDFKNNDWGTGGAPREGSVYGKVDLGFVRTVCCSNVVFIPGFEGSRLHLGSNQLWEPNTNADVEKLYLDDQGQSVNSNIAVGSIIDKTNSVGPIASKKIYQSFIENMDALVAQNTITSWKPLSYDWRFGLEEVAYPMISEIEKIAGSSKTGKVTIIAHSNGGLVAKTLFNFLKERGKDDLVDKIVMVAVPELGTPATISSLLHGDGTELGPFGRVLSEKNARKWGENMFSVYNLLPSSVYIDSLGAPVLFDSSLDQINTWRNTYGESIENESELEEFLLGKEGRQRPDFSDLVTPNVLNSLMLGRSQATHGVLDNFEVGTTTTFYQIAGWGKSTPFGIQYFATKHCGFSNFFCIGNSGLGLDHKNIENIEGDGTVVSSSASNLQIASSTYFVNLQKVNNDLSKNFEHSSILEVPSVLTLINNFISSDSIATDSYISTNKPSDTFQNNFEISVYSPVDLHFYDSKGNHTGFIPSDSSSDLRFVEENVPNSSYEEVGEGKYINLQNIQQGSIQLDGTGIGTFTLNIKETNGDRDTFIVFADIPVTDVTKAEITLSPNVSSTTLALDVDGDAKADFIVKPDTEIDPILYLSILKLTIKNFNLKLASKKAIEDKIDKVIKLLEKDKQKVVAKKLQKLSIKLANGNWKAKELNESQRNEITTLINEILDNI